MREPTKVSGQSILNPIPAKLRGPDLLHDLISISTNQDEPAIDYLDENGQHFTVTYGELASRSEHLSDRISKVLNGLPARDTDDQLIIPLMIPQSPDLYIAQLALLKAGAAFCPINLDAPSDRINFILKDIKAGLVVTTSALAQSISASVSYATVFCVDEETAIPAVQTEDGDSNGHHSRIPVASDLAYVMYTSGSTGTPKGVGISHSAATQSLLAHDRHIPKFSRFLQFAAPTFDVSVFEIFFPLFRGSTLVCCNRADMLTDLAGTIRNLDVDACELTPSVAGSLLKRRASAPKLKLVLTIGEMLTKPVVAEFGGNPENLSILWGMYGPTEAAIHCTLQPAFRRDASTRCIGFPLDTVSAFVAAIPSDGAEPHAFEIMPIGEVGELVVGGHQLATGYLNRPEQTAASFIDTEYGRVYRTGDKARMLRDGTIECLGRASDGQIKLNGQRMELGEIEHAILGTPGCHSAYVCVVSNIMVAFAAVESTFDMHENIKASCKKWLPAFMIPSEFVIMESFPRLPSGKVDRMGLKEGYSRSQGGGEDPIDDDLQFKDELEKTLCKIAQSVLEIPVRPATKLSSVGVDSLSAIQLASRFRDEDLPLSPLNVLDSETLRDLYNLLQELQSETEKSVPSTDGHSASIDFALGQQVKHDSVLGTKLEDIEMVTYCTSLQNSMVAESMKDPRLYVNTIDIRLPDKASQSAAKSWFLEIALKNEVLRSGFLHLNDNIVKVIWKRLPESQVRLVDDFSKEEIADIDAFFEYPFKVEIQNSPLSARIKIHHAVYDGWTMDLLLDDLSTLAGNGELPNRPPFSQIARYLEASPAQSDNAKEFWTEHLQGAYGSILPNFKTTAVLRPAVHTSKRSLDLDTQRVQLAASSLTASTHAIFQASLMWLWSSITGNDDVTIGSVFSGRTLPISGIEQTMGPCINTLPVRAKLSESSTIRDLIQSIHSTNRQIMRLSPISLTEIKKAIRMPRGSKIFDVVFVYQESLSSRKKGSNTIFEIDHEDRLETKLLLEVEPRGSSYSCRWTYHSDAFSRQQVQSLAGHFSHLCAYFVNQWESSISSVRSSFPEKSLSAYTSNHRQLEVCDSLATLIEQQSALVPNAEAIRFAHSIDDKLAITDSITYRQLNETANQISRQLGAAGVSQGGIVGIIMEKSISFYCGVLAILKAGCAYLPLLPSTPPQRVKLILEQAQPQLCIVDDVSLWKSTPLPCSFIDLRVQQYGQYPVSNLSNYRDSSQLAYVIFTSGTTGTPKGVSVTNKNMLSNIEALSRIYPLEGSTSMLQACSQAFDVSVFEIFFAWANGMCLCAATNDTLFEDLERSIRQLKVTHLSMTVTVASLVNPANVPDVQFLVTSGEPMTDEVLNKWEHALYQGYGPSETTNICTVRKVGAGDSSQFLGWSFDNTTSFVFSPESSEVLPFGSLGELCFGGDQVAAGYLNMPEMTSVKFFDHPEYGRLYRSGDLGRMLPDGSLIILGRLDSQIKLRGQRIELHEIQSTVLNSNIAKVCTCMVLEHPGAKSQQLALFYVPSSTDSQTFDFVPLTNQIKTDITGLYQFLGGSLPAYMMPSFIIPITCLPLTSSGKINTEHLRQSSSSLPAEILDQCSQTRELEDDKTDWNETEKHILDALIATHEIDEQSTNRWTSFATLGLDSISAMPLARRLQAKFERRIQLSQILQNPSISRLAHSIDSTAPNDSIKAHHTTSLLPDDLVELIRQRFTDSGHAVDNVLPCTPLQAAMLASTISYKDRSKYRNQMLFKINIEPERVISFWDHMRLRHGILRTCFVSTEHAQFPFVQATLENNEFNWARLQTSDLEQSALEHLEALPNPVDSFKPPLALATIETEDQQNYLSFVCHHALYDGVATGKLLAEFESLARGETLRPPPAFQPFLQEALSLPSDTDEFWSRQLKDFVPRRLHSAQFLANGANGANGTNGVLQPKLSGFHLPLSAIHAKLRESGTTILSLCQAAWSEVLASLLQTSDVWFGNVFNGRSLPLDDIDDLVAPCFNTVPMRIKLSESDSNRDLMKKCQNLNARILHYQFTPLRKIRSLMYNDNTGLFDTLLLLQPPAQQLDRKLWTLERDTGYMDVPIVCEVTPDRDTDKLNILIHTDTNQFSHSMEGLIQDIFVQALDNCLSFPSSDAELTGTLPSHLYSSVKHFQNLQPANQPSENNDEAFHTSSERPWSQVETQVRHIIAKLANIHIGKVGKSASIYRLGLDSISAVQAASLLRQEGLRISPVEILENPTCAGIASCIQTAEKQCAEPDTTYDLDAFQASIQQELAGAKLAAEPLVVLPCTPLQQGMISQFIISEGANYYNFISWKLSSDMNFNDCNEAWMILSGMHQMLRTGFVSISHPDTSFAMVSYEPGAAARPIQVLRGQEASSFNIGKWRSNCIKDSLDNLSFPPWQVILLDDAGSRSMHLGLHHALYDAASLRMILYDLRQLISGTVGNKVLLAIPSETIPKAVASILGESMTKEHGHKVFWKKQAETMVVNSFPTLTPLRVDVGKRLRASRTSDMALQTLRDCAASAGVTIQAALQSAWTRLLSGYQGDSAVTFGVVMSGRTDENLRDVAFPCITTLPVVVRNVDSNRELLLSMMDYNVALRRQEHTPLTRIQKWTGYPDKALFDTILVYQQASDMIDAPEPWQITSETATVDFPLSLEVEEIRSETLRMSLDYHSKTIPADHAELLLAQFDAILIHLLKSPEGRADDVIPGHANIYSILPAEHDELPSGATFLHQFVESTANATPDKLALEFVHDLSGEVQSRKWTYRELDHFGNRVAHLFRKNKVQPGGIVAVCFDKCPEAYFTILGILKAGCAFVALDPSAPVSRHQFILEDSSSPALMVQKGNCPEVASTAPCPVFEIDLANLESYPTTPLEVSCSPGDPCYCLYTSGTTGTPKGCLITHDNAVQAMLAFQRLFSGHWDAESRWLQFASFHFDVSVLEQYWSWSVGIPVVSAPRDLILSDLISTITKLGITHIDLTPSLARLVHPDEVPSLCKGVFITGGEQLRQDILDVWGSKGVIYNAYGPTEATIGVTMYCRVPQDGRSSNIGKQFPNVGTFVLRPGSDVAVLKGGIGELCISGKLVGKGYLNRPELTDERFPVLEQFGQRVYRTGDLVRVLHDGCFDFLGRADDQVKLRGQRLEIGEINHAIKAGVSTIVDVATLVTKHRGQDRDVMVSFIVTENNNNRNHELAVLSDQKSLDLCLEAQNACRAKLPGYMVPTYMLCVPYIPLSANNKAQTSILKEVFNGTSPEELRKLSAGSYSKGVKLTALNMDMARVVANVTRTDAKNFSSSMTIFDLGIDSISVIDLARQLRAAGFTSAAPSTILQNPRLNALAEVLKDDSSTTENNQLLQVKQSVSACYHRHLGSACRRFNIKPDDIEYIAPCTSLQEGMLARSSTSEGRATYFNSFVLDLDSNASVKRLRGAWGRAVEAHAILRTSFLQTADGYVQVAIKGTLLKWNEVDLDDTKLEDYCNQKLDAWVESNEQALVNPLEVDFIKLGDRRTLAIRIFHGIYDARSLDLILQHIQALYDERDIVSGPGFIGVLPYGPLCDFSFSKPFWEDLFSGFSHQHLPKLSSRPSQHDAIVTRSFNVETVEMKRVEYAVTQQTVIQAAWASVLARQLHDWPSMGVVVSGRSLMLKDVENTIGPLFNTLPFRLGNTDSDGWLPIIQATHNYNASILSFAHVPLRQVQKWCSQGQPLFDNLFAFDRDTESMPVDTPTLWTNVRSKSIADYPLAFEGVVTKQNSLKVTLVAQPHIADESALNSLLDDFQRALNGIVSDNDFPVVQNKTPSESMSNSTGARKSSTSPRFQNNVDAFVWTSQARELRKEIAVMAGTSIEQVTEDTTLFELGLDSIDAVKLVTRLRRIGIVLMTSQLMKKPTIRGILITSTPNHQVNGDTSSEMEILEAMEVDLADHLKTTGLDFSEVEAVLPPTHLQDSMVAEMVASDFQRYLNHDVLELSRNTDLTILRTAIETVIEKSPILRTVFVELDDPKFSPAYGQVIMRGLDPFKKARLLENIQDIDQMIEDARIAAADSKGRSELLQLRPVFISGRQYLVLSISHALYDGMSLDLFHRDVQAAYGNAYRTRSSYKPTLARILGSSSDAAERFWSGFLQNAHPTLLPESTSDVASLAGTVHRLKTLSKVPMSIVRTYCRSQGITTQALCQACWAVVLSTLARSLSVTFGVVLSGRASEEEQGLMFPTMNTIAISTVLHGTVSEYVQYVWENLTSINEFQFFPLRKAQKLAGAGGPLFNTLFTMQSSPDELSDDNAAIWKSVQSSSEVEYPLCVEVEVVDDQLIWRIACDDQYVSKDYGQSVLDHLDEVLQWLLENQNTQIIDFSADSVSICGLTPFPLSEVKSTDKTFPPADTRDGDVEWSQSESVVVDVLAEVSGIDHSAISPSQSIYHLGLDSISAIKVSTMLRKQGIVVSVRDMVKATSIRDIARKGNGANHPRDAVVTTKSPLNASEILASFDVEVLISKAGLNPTDVEHVLPALPMQVHMLSVWARTGGELYFYEFSYDVIGDVSPERVTAAWHKLVADIPILRTYFVETDSSDIPFAQIVARPGAAPPVEETDDNASDCWNVQLKGSTFVSLQVTKFSTEGTKLVLKMHHALYDGVSLPLIIGRLILLCGSQESIAAPALEPWKQFVLAQHEADIRQRRRGFWKAYLDGASMNDNQKPVPLSEQRKRTAEFRPSTLKDLTHIRALALEKGIGLQALFFAAYAKCLSAEIRMAQEQTAYDVTFGIYLANRTAFARALDDLPYPTLSIVPLRVMFSPTDSLADVAKRVQDDITEISSFENVSVGLWEIAEWTGLKIASFVNFLSLPDQDAEMVSNGELQLRETTPAIHPDYHTSKSLSNTLAKPFDNRVKDAYIDAVDVEAAVRGNSMDIGVFAPASLLPPTQATDLILRIVEVLQET